MHYSVGGVYARFTLCNNKLRNASRYEHHFRRRGTETAVRFSIKQSNYLITQHFDPKIKQIRLQLRGLKSKNTSPKKNNINNNKLNQNQNENNKNNNNNQGKKSKSELWLDLVLLGMSRSLSFVFLNCLYHILCHLFFAIIARRHTKDPKNNEKPEIFRRKLLQFIEKFHTQATSM